MSKTKVLIIAPRHYIKDLQDSYSSASCTLSYFAEEEIKPNHINGFLGKVSNKYDAYVGLADFSSLIAAWLNHENGSYGPKPESLALLQDKYLSRKLQYEHRLYDGIFGHLDGNHALEEDSFPVFVKPRRASMSWLAGTVHSPDELAEYTSEANTKLLKDINHRWVKTYEALRLENKQDFKVDDFVYESLLPHGDQVTLDGYIQNGNTDFFGFTKSVFMPNNISFKRFDFPFHFSRELSEDIKEHAKKFLKASKFDNSMFNIEFKVDHQTGDFAVVEINTRASSQFMYPIQVVTGVHPLDIAIDISLGVKVEHSPQQTKHKMCSVCVLRRPDDAKVLRVPTDEDIEPIWKKLGQGKWNSFVSEGEKLSDYPNDSHTYRFAELIVPHSDMIHVHDYEDYVVDKVTKMYHLEDLKDN